MTDAVTAGLIDRLLSVLVARLTSGGHLMQQVSQERRGNCLPPSAGCSQTCREAQRLRDEATVWLEHYAASLDAQPRQMALAEVGA